MTVVVTGPMEIGGLEALMLGGAALLAIAVSFFIGALNPASWLGRLLGRDVTASGSGNPGATNAGRVLGVKWGVLVGVLDVLKGFVPVFFAARTFGAFAGLVGVAVVAGHMYSPFLKGRGGKGVATALGAMLAWTPWVALLAVIVFGVSVAIYRITGIGSIITCAVLVGVGVLAAVLQGVGDALDVSALQGSWVAVLAALVLWRHRSNIRGWRRAVRR